MASIDYWSGVFKGVSSDDVLCFMGRWFSGWIQVRGSHGYKAAWATDGVRIYFDGSADMGVYVQVSGSGCAALNGHPSFESWAEWCAMWWDFGGTVNRVDIAYDDKSGVTLWEDVARALDDGDYTSRFRTLSNGDVRTEGEYTKQVRYLGSIESDSSLCVYNKRLERLAAGEQDPGVWVRFELRFRGKSAEAFASWLSGQPELNGAESWLRGAVEFRSHRADTKKDRWPVAEWWLQFLQECGKMRVSVARPSRTLVQRVERFVKQHAATLAMLTLCMCEGRLYGKWLNDLLSTGWGRMSREQALFVRNNVGHFPGTLPLLGD